MKMRVSIESLYIPVIDDSYFEAQQPTQVSCYFLYKDLMYVPVALYKML